MDPLAAIGLASTAVSVAAALYELGEGSFHEFLRNFTDYGPARALLLHTIFWQAKGVISRVRRHVLNDPGGPLSMQSRPREKEAWSLKKSYAATLNMIAVAGAIVAQIAITALTLPYLEHTHWTAEAAFVVSLIAGLLAVYYACMVQLRLGSLQGPEEVKQWLTTHRASRARPRDTDEPKGAGHAERSTIHIPSYYSALLLVAPSELLNWSLVSLLAGIGIYFGLVFTEKLGMLRGANSNLAVLISYVVFTVGALGSYFLPSLLKLVETSDSAERALGILVNKYRPAVARSRQFSDDDPSSTSAAARSNTGVRGIDRNGEDSADPESRPASTYDMMRSLQQSISAQVDSLRAQEDLLKSYLQPGQ